MIVTIIKGGNYLGTNIEKDNTNNKGLGDIKIIAEDTLTKAGYNLDFYVYYESIELPHYYRLRWIKKGVIK